MSHAIPAIEKAEREIGLPDTIATTFTGAAAEFRSSLTSEPFLILAAVIVIYIVLGVLYESYIHPITILSTLPSAGVGALLALIICRTDFSLVALIGIILLIGIVKKNAIMMIDFALEAERKEGMSPEESIYQACLLRFRPIMMTTAAALLGALPLALEHGTGSELRRPLGISIVGGLLLSQFLTLYTTPVIYLYLDRLGRWMAERRNRGELGQAQLPLIDIVMRNRSPNSRGWMEIGNDRRFLSMSVSEPFIRRPVGTSLLAAGVLLLGAVAYHFLPVAPLPKVDFPTISVSAQEPGVDPATAASSLAAPLERRFAQIAGVSEITSVSSLGGSNITIQFDLNRDINGAARDVQSAINAASGELPSGLPQPPSYRKANPSDAPIMVLAMTSDTQPLSRSLQSGRSNHRPAHQPARRRSQVIIGGGANSAVRVQINPVALASMGLSLEDIRTTLSQVNVLSPKGALEGPEQRFVIASNDQLTHAEQYQPIIVAQHNGAAVPLRDVGTAIDAQANRDQAGLFNNKRAVLLVIFKQPDANVVRTTDLIHAILPQLRTWLPPSVSARRDERSHNHDPFVRARRADHARVHDGAGCHGDVPFSAPILADIYFRHHHAARAGRHIRRDVAVRLQPRQSLAHGIDRFDRLCGR